MERMNDTNSIPTIDDIRAQVKGLTGSDPEFTGHGLHVEFCGVTLSLQWGPQNYCDNRGPKDISGPCANFEAAAWLNEASDAWLSLDSNGADVRGWVAWGDLAALVHDVKVLAHKAGA